MGVLFAVSTIIMLFKPYSGAPGPLKHNETSLAINVKCSAAFSF